jgi:hypothetical protein
MGKQQHVIQTVFNAVAGVGFEGTHPKWSPPRELRVALTDMQIVLQKVLNDKTTEYDLVRFIRNKIRSDAANMGGMTQHYLIWDNHEDVTKAKDTERAKRAQRARMDLTRLSQKVYTDAEMDEFFLESRWNDATALHAAPVPSGIRLRASSGEAKNRAMRRLSALMKHAALTSVYGEGQLIYIVQDGTCGTYDTSKEDVPAEFLGEEESPEGIHEAEMLCVHYAFKEIATTDVEVRDQLAIMIHCNDTDTFLPLVANAWRVIFDGTTESDKLPSVYLNLTAASSAAKDVSEAATADDGAGGEEDAAAAPAVAKEVKYQATPYVDVVRVYIEFTKNARAKTPATAPWHNFAFPLFTLGLISGMCGSEKVEEVKGAGAETLFKAFVTNAAAIQKHLFAEKQANEVYRLLEVESPFDDAREPSETPAVERVAKRLRVVVDEPTLAAVFVFMCAAKTPMWRIDPTKSKNGGPENDVSTHVLRILGASELDKNETLDRALGFMSSLAMRMQTGGELLQKVWDDTEGSDADKKLATVAAWKEIKAIWDRSDGDVFNMTPPASALPPTKRPRASGKPQPADSIEALRGRVRRAVWQLTGEYVNGMVANGLPPCDETDAESSLSKWGRNADGSLCDKIVPFSPTMNLY